MFYSFHCNASKFFQTVQHCFHYINSGHHKILCQECEMNYVIRNEKAVCDLMWQVVKTL